jgi:signal transduction histidine kinase
VTLRLRGRALLVLCGMAALPMALALVFQDQALTRDLELAAERRVGRAAESARSLVDAHLAALVERYRAISGAPQFRANLEIGDGATLAHYADELRRRQGATRVLFLDADDRVIAGAGDAAHDVEAIAAGASNVFAAGDAMFAVASVPLETDGLALGRLVAVERVRTDTLAQWAHWCGARLRVGRESAVHAAVSARVRPLGGADLWVISSFGSERDALVRSRWNLLRAGAVALLAALALSLFMARDLVDPIQRLKEAAERIGRGDLAARVPVTRNDEIGELSATLNEMAQRIDDDQRALQRTNADLLELNRAIEIEKERALAASRAKSDFLANTSHEIRTPLTAVLGYADLLLEREAISGEEREWVATIRRNGDHLLQLVDDTLDISRIEAGKLRVERSACRPIAIVEEAVAMLRAPARAKGLELRVEYASLLPERIETDAIRLRQILVNLVGNAVKFTERGEVRLRVRLEEDPAPRLEFEVLDTGIGISPDYRARMFEPFSQADTSSTRRFGGTGLGLAITRRLVEYLGGEISVESEPGRGSHFRFWIDPGPLAGVPRVSAADARLARTSTPGPAAGQRSGARVLLAEDSPDNQRLIVTLLGRAGYAVEVVGNGELAVARALAALEDEEPFAVVLMDMQMPVLDGYEATGRLRRAGYTGAIVALTAHAMQGDREKCIHAGCDDFAAKPIQPPTLIELIARHARKAEPTEA